MDALSLHERDKYRRIWREPSYRRVSPGLDAAARVFRALGMKPGQSLIDYGSGPGLAAAEFQADGLDVTCVDIAENALAPGLSLNVVIASLWELPEWLGPSDWCFCCDVLEHIPPERVDDVLSGIAARTHLGGFLQPATRADRLGPRLIGEPLHLTIRPREWWLEMVSKHFDVREVDVGSRPAKLSLHVTTKSNSKRSSYAA